MAKACVMLDSLEAPDKPDRLHELAVARGMVSNTLLDGTVVQGELETGGID